MMTRKQYQEKLGRFAAIAWEEFIVGTGLEPLLDSLGEGRWQFLADEFLQAECGCGGICGLCREARARWPQIYMSQTEAANAKLKS